MIPQQILLREFMRIRTLTRNTMAEYLGITRRRLDSWLLPDDSNNFRSASDNVLRSIETQLRTQVHWHPATPLPDGFDEQRVRMVLSRTEVVFPLPWLIVEEAPGYEIQKAVKVKGKRVSLAERLKNKGNMERYETLVLGRDTPYSPQYNGCVVEARPLVKAELVDGVAYWIFMGLRIFRWTARLKTGTPTNYPSEFLVDGARFLVSFIVGCCPVSNKNSSHVGSGMARWSVCPASTS